MKVHKRRRGTWMGRTVRNKVMDNEDKENNTNTSG
jgi:hypothetical protein